LQQVAGKDGDVRSDERLDQVEDLVGRTQSKKRVSAQCGQSMREGATPSRLAAASANFSTERAGRRAKSEGGRISSLTTR